MIDFKYKGKEIAVNLRYDIITYNGKSGRIMENLVPFVTREVPLNLMVEEFNKQGREWTLFETVSDAVEYINDGGLEVEEASELIELGQRLNTFKGMVAYNVNDGFFDYISEEMSIDFCLREVGVLDNYQQLKFVLELAGCSCEIV